MKYVVVALLLMGPAAEAKPDPVDQRVRRHIRKTWVADWREKQALNVATCESGLNPRAKNDAGYWGLFQLGEWERERAKPWTWRIKVQVRAAKRYFNMTGRDWSAWSCSPA